MSVIADIEEAFAAHWSLFGRWPKGELHDERGVLWFETPIAHLPYNGVLRTRMLLVYARWWAWYGGATWGPRFFLFACLPAALVLARRTARPEAHSPGANLLALLAVALSCWVGTSGLVYGEYDQEQFRANDFALEYLTWYVPECSALWRPFVVPKPLGRAEWVRLAAFAVGFVYLAGPVARVLAGQLRDRASAAWRAARGPWRV